MTLLDKLKSNVREYLHRVRTYKFACSYFISSLTSILLGIILGFIFKLYSTAMTLIILGGALNIYASATAWLGEDLPRIARIVVIVSILLTMPLALLIDLVWKIQDVITQFLPSLILWSIHLPIGFIEAAKVYCIYTEQQKQRRQEKCIKVRL